MLPPAEIPVCVSAVVVVAQMVPFALDHGGALPRIHCRGGRDAALDIDLGAAEEPGLVPLRTCAVFPAFAAEVAELGAATAGFERDLSQLYSDF